MSGARADHDVRLSRGVLGDASPEESERERSVRQVCACERVRARKREHESRREPGWEEGTWARALNPLGHLLESCGPTIHRLSLGGQ